jgi:hypothetical protein
MSDRLRIILREDCDRVFNVAQHLHSTNGDEIKNRKGRIATIKHDEALLAALCINTSLALVEVVKPRV